MSSDEQSDKECPLCMEPFDEINFFPCSCQYQICTFCWHRIRTDENGLCPACRQPYPEQPVNFQPTSSVDMRGKQKNEKKQKNRDKNGGKLGTSDGGNGARKADRQHLSVFRVLQRNLVYVIGLSQRLADAELLKKQEYFGKFGRIVKIAVSAIQTPSNNTLSNGHSSNNGGSFTAYVTYGKMEEALKAIQTINNLVVDGRLLKASLGTTKYCSNFLKGQNCHKQECMYLHEIADDELSFTKEDMHQGKHTEYERKLHEQMVVLAQQPKRQITQKRKDISNNQRNSSPQFDVITAAITETTNATATHTSTTTMALTTATEEETAATATVSTPPLDSTPSPTSPLRLSSEAATTIAAAMTEPTSVPATTTMSGALTCMELEQMLINHSAPPGSHDAPPGFCEIPAEYRNGGSLGEYYRGSPSECGEISRHFGTFSDYREAPSVYDVAPPPGFHLPESSREPSVVSSAANFFLDLYDDLGFDPFTESSKALADLLEQEKSSSPR